MTEQPPEGQTSPVVQIPPDQIGGVWSNFAQVSHSEFEFTIDFMRLDYARQPLQGIVVSRVNMSPLMVSQLIDALGQNWARYAEKALPKEVFGNDGTESE